MAKKSQTSKVEETAEDKAAAKKPRTELFEKTECELFVPLTDEEVIEAAEKAAKAQRTIGLLDLDFDKAKKAYKEAVQNQQSIIFDNMSKVESKKEMRPVEVEIHADWKEMLMHYVRLDTGDIYRTRPATKDEQQMKLFKEEDANRKIKAAEVAKEIHASVFGVETADERKEGVTFTTDLDENGNVVNTPQSSEATDIDAVFGASE